MQDVWEYFLCENDDANKFSPYLRQHCLWQTGQHEDFYDLRSIYEAIVVDVGFLK